MIRGVLLALAAVALAGSAVAWAVPPGGVADTPGTPPGSVAITTPEVSQKGKVGFCVQGFRVDLAAGGSVGQQFMVKFDDFGNSGIGPFTPNAAGELCAEVSTDPADHGSKASDRIPADLCDPSKEHWLRLLSGPWAYNKNGDVASLRSLSATFRVTGICGDATTTPDAGATPTATPTPAATTSASLVSRKLTVTGGTRVTVKLRGGSAAQRVRVVLRTASKVRVGTKRRVVTLASASYQLGKDTRRTVRPKLTSAGRALLRARRTLAGRLTLQPTGAQATRAAVTLRRG